MLDRSMKFKNKKIISTIILSLIKNIVNCSGLKEVDRHLISNTVYSSNVSAIIA